MFRGRFLGPITITGRATLFVAGILSETVPGMVAGLPITLASLQAALGLRHSSVGAAAALVLSVVMAAIAAEGRVRAAQGWRGTVQGRGRAA